MVRAKTVVGKTGKLVGFWAAFLHNDGAGKYPVCEVALMSSTNREKREPKRSFLRWIPMTILGAFMFAIVGSCVVLAALYLELTRNLPSTQSLKSYHPPLVSSIYASDGTLVGEFFNERRYLVPLDAVPDHVCNAFLAAEDVRSYEHQGIDLVSILRAFFKNVQAGEIVQGGSTITQQVVKSLLLTPERTFLRKAKEALLAYRIDQSLTKQEILCLYLNQIYFGSGAYGVEAASRAYFDKHVQELDLAEASMLAGLPKAPSRFSPLQNYAAARERQQYVLQRMAEVGFVSPEKARTAMGQEIHLARQRPWTLKNLNHFVEEVRRQVETKYGRDKLYKEGLRIYTTMDTKGQEIAQKALDQGLRELDRRHRRYRGLHVNSPREEWPNTLKVIEKTNGDLGQGNVVVGLVKSFDAKTGACRVSLGQGEADLPPAGYAWTQVSSKRAPKVFRVGDVIRVKLDKLQDNNVWMVSLEQDPAMEGALLSIAPDTGRVFCMVGGRDFQKSQFNRCTQALRQPGSSFKPIIYGAALEKGYNQSSILVDSPVILPDHSLRGHWKPANYDHQFWGPIPLRRALVHSRNVVTVKLLGAIGVDHAIEYARRLGIVSDLTRSLALALGASDVTLWEIITAYSAFANLGERVEPYLIEKILDRDGRVIYEHEPVRERVIAPETAYVMTNLLQGAVEEGTGQRAKKLGRPAAGKTGTTNEMRDAWFVGYTPDVLTGVWVGYDDHNVSLGKGETGGRAACPIWLYFMEEFLKERPVETFPIPPEVILAKINPHSGALAGPDDPSAVYAAFAGALPAVARAASSESEDGGLSAGGGADSSGSSDSEAFFKSDLF